MYMQFFKAHFLDSDIQFDSLPNKKSLKFGCPHSVSEEDISFFFWLNLTGVRKGFFPSSFSRLHE